MGGKIRACQAVAQTQFLQRASNTLLGCIFTRTNSCTHFTHAASIKKPQHDGMAIGFA